MMFVLGILIFFVGILFSVAWHELGHFVTARWFGIKVPEFMVGFGKTIWSVRRGETEYGLKAIPLGGYIRMIGMIPPAPGEALGRSRRSGPFQGLIDDVRKQSAMDVRPEDAHRQFYLRAPWKRIIVMAAGPIMNLILAILLFAVLLMGIGIPGPATTTVESVSACVLPAATAVTEAEPVCGPADPPTPAAAAGFQAGDRIVAIEGQTFESSDGVALRAAIQGSAGPTVVTVERDGRRLELTPTPIRNQVYDTENPDQIIEAGFLGIRLQQSYVQQSPGAVVSAIGDVVSRTGRAIAELPSRVPGLFGSAFLGEERDQNGPIGI
ncbi:MAG: site-2 protease family protein, partial [Pseudonocardia sp.]|nr:site-2 protease family protein [Pseudonocardia sp.]